MEHEESIEDIKARIREIDRQRKAENQSLNKAFARLSGDQYQRLHRIERDLKGVEFLQTCLLIVAIVHISLYALEAYLGIR